MSPSKSSRAFRILRAVFSGVLLSWTGLGLAASREEILPILQMVDYIGVDYPECVRDGGVLNESGYAEQREFSADVVRRIAALPESSGKAGLVDGARGLQTAIADKAHTAKAKAHNDYWLPWFSQRTKALGLHPYPSVANFVLVKFPSDPKLSAEAALKFLNARRILPRRVAAYGLPDCLRITIADEGAVKACAAALEEFVKGAATQ